MKKGGIVKNNEGRSPLVFHSKVPQIVEKYIKLPFSCDLYSKPEGVPKICIVQGHKNDFCAYNY